MDDATAGWDADTFRREAHRMVDWIADYLDGGARRHPVLSRLQPGDVADRLPASMPTGPEPPEAIWDDFLHVVLPGITHWNHPGFMAYFGITGSGPGILGELASAALTLTVMIQSWDSVGPRWEVRKASRPRQIGSAGQNPDCLTLPAPQ